MKIAVTGTTGFIGRHLLKFLSVDNEIVSINRDKNVTIHENQDNILSVISNYSIESLTGAIAGCESVVHLAGVRFPTGGEKNSLKRFEPNISMAENLFESCLNNQIKNIVNISSISVYGQQNTLPFIEYEQAVPDSDYGRSKLESERIAEKYILENGLCIKTLRLSKVFGIGEVPHYIPLFFINKSKEHQTLEIFGNGSGTREYLYINDAVEAIGLSLKYKSPETFNIGTGIAISVLEVAETINKVFGNVDNIKFVGTNQEFFSTEMNCKKASELLGFDAKWNFEEALWDLQKEL